MEYRENSLINKIKNYGKNYINFNSVESIFNDFKRKTFIENVFDKKYINLDKALKNKNKNTL